MTEIAAPEAAPVRLDIFLARHLPGVGRRAARALIARGAVRLNGRRTRKADMVHPNDLVCVAEPASAASVCLPPEADLPIAVLHADDVMVAIDKPPGMPVHALRPGERGTAANFLVARYPEVSRLGSALEAGLVNRLDTGTSGVLLAARSPDAHSNLRRMFGTRQVSKLYLAIVVGNIARGGRIATPIAHAPHNRRRMCVCPNSSRARVSPVAPLLRSNPALAEDHDRSPPPDPRPSKLDRVSVGWRDAVHK